jgi:ComF family protein
VISERLRKWSGSLNEAFDRLVFPSICEVCGKGGLPGPFCEDCRRELIEAAGSVCPRCAMPVGPHTNLEKGCADCRGHGLGFDAAVALGTYQGPIRALCLSIKNEPSGWLCAHLTDLLMESQGEVLRSAHPCCVVPVPLHWRRRIARGYNQADALADRLSKRLKVPRVHALRRVASTPKLARLGREERANLMRHAFTAKRSRITPGGTLILVDDILTTGSTCGAAARALKASGASRVIAAVIGRAEGRI